ncbi:MAG: hypothetical protein FWD78_14480 [Treponema sp.]|nr:hypothetical protein [Treponema sp.]
MKTINEKLEQWAIGKIEAEFHDDVCLVLRHKTLKLDRDSGVTGLESYVPNTTRSNALARTFIINGIGYDLFPQTWESLEKMADVDHYNLTSLNDAEIIWAQRETDRQRFESLQARFRANLRNPDLMLKRAQNWVNSAADLFADMLFETKVYMVRQNAGYICDFLAMAIAYTNGTYFHHGHGGELDELKKLKNVPGGFGRMGNFIEKFELTIIEKNIDLQKKFCRELIQQTKNYLCSLTPQPQLKKHRAGELADWYHELSYTWRRIYHYCDAGDAVTAYLWGCMLQGELVQVAGEYDVTELDIMGAYDSKNIKAFAESAAKAEQAITEAIKADGTRLDTYADIDEFLAKNN